MKLSLDEIADWKAFESLSHAYFLKEKESKRITDIIKIDVTKSGTGPDDGQDLLIEIQVTDGLTEFKRKWVVQCKWYDMDIAPSHLSDDNIPTLIHSYGAVGYLLICRKEPTSKLTRLFERLNKECIHGYKYLVWGGEQFCINIETQNDTVLLNRFFPLYSEYIKKPK